MSAEVASIDSFLNWSLNQFSKEFGIARETVGRRLREAGVKPSGKRHNHPVYRVGECAVAILVPQLSDGALLNDPEKMVPKERSDWYKSENERLKFENDSGLSIDVNESIIQMGEIARCGLHVLETLPDILERDFNLPPAVIDRVESRSNDGVTLWQKSVERGGDKGSWNP